MRKVDRLKASAMDSARWRGHDMKRFRTTGPGKAFSECRKCGATVDVDTRPAPNGIDVGGAAVAINCK